MLELDKQDVIKHLALYGNTITHNVEEPKLIIEAKYGGSIGKIFSLGAINAVLEDINYHPSVNEETIGHAELKFRILGHLDLVRERR